MKRTFVLIGLVVLLIIGGVVYAALHFSSIPVLDPQGIIGKQERLVLVLTVALCAIVVIPVFVMLFSFAWTFRASSPNAFKEHSPNWDHDSWWTSEIVWWLVPSAIVVVLAVIAWQSAHALDPYKPIPSANPPITVQVIALDWKWLFIYPQQGIATVNYLEFPVNTPVHFEITADAPMNSFWIPSLGGQIMAMAGMTNQLYLMTDKVGTFNGLSANISGAGFAGMNFKVYSVSQSDFSTWVSTVQKTNNPLSSSTYTTLSQPSQNVLPIYYSSIDPQLYTTNVMKYMLAPAQTSQQAATTTMPAMQGMQMNSTSP
jgi:cytochrome o ubiquinol oxidase subunit 2